MNLRAMTWTSSGGLLHLLDELCACVERGSDACDALIRGFDRRARSRDLRGRSDEDTHFVRRDTIHRSFHQPRADHGYLGFWRFGDDDAWFRTVEERDGAPPIFDVAIHVSNLWPEQPI